MKGDVVFDESKTSSLLVQAVFYVVLIALFIYASPWFVFWYLVINLFICFCVVLGRALNE